MDKRINDLEEHIDEQREYIVEQRLGQRIDGRIHQLEIREERMDKCIDDLEKRINILLKCINDLAEGMDRDRWTAHERIDELEEHMGFGRSGKEYCMQLYQSIDNDDA